MGLESFLTSTMLIERACGVGAYTLALILACNALCVGKRPSVKGYLFAYCLVLTLLSFFYIPGASSDLVHHLENLHQWSTASFSKILDYSVRRSSPSTPLYFWIIGQFHIDGLLPAVTSFIGYSCLFSCLADFADRYSCKRSNVALALALLMSTGFIMGFVSGIRNIMSFAIIVWCFYGESFKGRSVIVSIPFYLFAGSMHPAALFAVTLRLLFLLVERGQTILQRLASIVFVAGVGFAFARYGSEYLEEMTEKGSSYLAGGVYSYIWEYLVYIMVVLFIVYALVVSRHQLFEVKGSTVFMQASRILCVLVICVAPFNYTIFTRFSVLLLMVFSIVVLSLLEDQSFLKTAKNFKGLLKLAIGACLALACVRGNLSGFKFFLL